MVGRRGIFFDPVMFYSSLLFFLFLVLFFKSAWCLKLVSLHVPNLVVVGEDVQLQCAYDLEGDPLYSIKWYRDDVEFYRYVPRDKPPGQFFPLKGVSVDTLRSVNGTLILLETDETTTGNYKCEVSADAPSFQTVSTHRKLRVTEFLASGCKSGGHLQRGLLLVAGLFYAFLW
ncbi:uncharacterized protein [Parasteatoda tepidariorum]|nr:uncharacterized protein LOC122270512 [Parasteatoda tepidariorum]